jgi:chromosomal replication initiator protein
MDQRGLWQAVLGELELSLSKANFATWFKHTSIISNADGHVVVGVPNIFTKEWLEKKYHSDIEAALGKIGNVISVEYHVGTAKKDLELAPSALLAQAAPADVVSQPVAANAALNPKYTFDTFVVGSSNELAYAACQAVAKTPGTKYNPLFIYGGVGLGKTHLMQAVGNAILAGNPNKRIEYVTSEEFTNEFLASLARKKTQSFAEKYRSADVLIVDDIQFLATKERTVEEFFHTFNALHQAGKQIILSSDKPPQAITGLEDRLKSRFASGMIADVQAPDLETRSAILQTKSSSQGFALPREVIEYLARNISQNVRELEGALTQLIAQCEFRGLEPNIATATAVLGNIAASRPRLKPLSPKAVIEKTATYYDLRPEDITGTKRDKEIVGPRQMAMYVMRHEMNLSFPKIAQSCGGRDHTTAIHSVTKIERELERDENLRAELNAIKERLFV